MSDWAIYTAIAAVSACLGGLVVWAYLDGRARYRVMVREAMARHPSAQGHVDRAVHGHVRVRRDVYDQDRGGLTPPPPPVH
jgi:hypothetical protein